MESKAKLLGHPIHQMLIPFPFGLLATAVIFDIVYLLWGNPTMVTVSYWMIVAGIIGGVVAAPFGLIDYLAIPKGTRAKSVGLLHGLGNVVVLVLLEGGGGCATAVPAFFHTCPAHSHWYCRCWVLRWRVARGGLAENWLTA